MRRGRRQRECVWGLCPCWVAATHSQNNENSMENTQNACVATSTTFREGVPKYFLLREREKKKKKKRERERVRERERRGKKGEDT